MKVLIVALGIVAADPSEFCHGFRDGYGAGWCGDDALQCDPPKEVPCPAPKAWQRDSYWEGFANGRPVGEAHDRRFAPGSNTDRAVLPRKRATGAGV